MRTAIATVVVVISAVSASAQPAAPITAPPPAKTVTVTGCVAGGSGSQPFTLANALVLPDSSTQVAAKDSGKDSASPILPVVSPTPTEPAGSGTATAGMTPGAVGTSGSAAPGATGTSGSKDKEKDSIGSYRLAGTDMRPWAGKRVKIVGVVVAAPLLSPAVAGSPASLSAITAPPELQVESVEGVPGPCPKQ